MPLGLFVQNFERITSAPISACCHGNVHLNRGTLLSRCLFILFLSEGKAEGRRVASTASKPPV